MAKKTRKSAEAAVEEIAETLAEDVTEELKEIAPEKLSEIPPEETVSEGKKTEKKEKKKPIFSILAGERVITESSDEARELYNQSRFGSLTENGKVELSLLEALYLLERSRLIVKSEAGKEIVLETYVRKARKVEPNFWIDRKSVV